MSPQLNERFRRIEKEIKERTIQPGRGYAINRGPGGTILSIKSGQPGDFPANTFFLLEAADVIEDEEVTANKIRVRYSTLADAAPDDFQPSDSPPFLFTITEAGIVYAHLEIDSETGEVTGRTIENGTEIPDDTDTDFYCEIGTYDIDDETDGTTCANGRYGPIGANICRNWFVSPVKYGVTFF
jgi:hypothetical protein